MKRSEVVVEEGKKPTPVWTAKMDAVESGSDENDRFFTTTPAGELTLQCLSGEHFGAGKEYYLDFTEAPSTVAADNDDSD